jgi:uncharacterized protein YidB (DUF937 family)
MGFLDTIESMAGQSATPPNQNAQVAGGLMEELGQHPGGLGSILDSFRHNGMDQHVNNWATGASQTATPEQVQTGLGGTGIIERVAARAGVSPQVATIALSTVLPLVIQHFTNQQGQPVPQSSYGGLASTVLGKLL